MQQDSLYLLTKGNVLLCGLLTWEAATPALHTRFGLAHSGRFKLAKTPEFLETYTQNVTLPRPNDRLHNIIIICTNIVLTERFSGSVMAAIFMLT